MDIDYQKTKSQGGYCIQEPVWECEGLLLEVISLFKYRRIVCIQIYGIHGTCMRLVLRAGTALATLLKSLGNLNARHRLGCS